MKTITEQLRNLGFNNQQIKHIHNVYFNQQYESFKNYDKVEIVSYKGESLLRFYDEKTGMIREIGF